MLSLSDLQDIAYTGVGLTGEYFPTADLSGTSVAKRLDATVSIATPPAGLPLPFSVRWTGYFFPRYTETYTFSAQAEGGIRLYLGTTKAIDAWKVQAFKKVKKVQVKLEADQPYDIKIEYTTGAASAQVDVKWQSKSQASESLPTIRLFPTDYNFLQGTVASQPEVVSTVLGFSYGQLAMMGGAALLVGLLIFQPHKGKDHGVSKAR